MQPIDSKMKETKLPKAIEDWIKDNFEDSELIGAERTAEHLIGDCEHRPEFTNKIPGWFHSPDSEVQCIDCEKILTPIWIASVGLDK